MINFSIININCDVNLIFGIINGIFEAHLSQLKSNEKRKEYLLRNGKKKVYIHVSLIINVFINS